jgi:ubiquinone/menaquinone biosynthesis C-methylase UbiE
MSPNPEIHGTRSKQEIRRTYNQISQWYGVIAGASEAKFLGLGIRFLHPLPGEHILEIGCGPGHSLTSLSQGVTSTGKVIGLDISEGMLGQARKHIQKTNLDPPVVFHLGDACHLPYASNRFSAVFLGFTIELFERPEILSVLTESSRILKPDGRIGIVCLLDQDCLPVHIYQFFHRSLPLLVDCQPILIRPILEETGFYITTSTSKRMWGLPVDILVANKILNRGDG